MPDQAEIDFLATLEHPRRLTALNYRACFFDTLIPCDPELRKPTLLCSLRYKSCETETVQPGTYHILATA